MLVDELAEEVLLIHHGEIVLKGRKRGFFERLLMRNIEYVLGSAYKVTRDENRLIIFSREAGWGKALEELRYVAGVSNFSLAIRCRPTIEAIVETAKRLLHGMTFSTFSADAKRSFKGHPYNSIDVKLAISRALTSEYGARTNYENPDVRLYIEVTRENAYVYRERMAGFGGLPVGSTGRVLMLLSGGVDSALASLMLIRRGCRLDYLHFHSYRSGEEALKSKIGALTEHLTRYGLRSTLHISDFTPFYRRVFQRSEKMEVPLFRRYMFMVADRLAERHGCRALATGDSLAQVASQTLSNIASAENHVTRPILRPLIAYSKNEILEQAGRFNILSLALRDYKDCCSILGRHPATTTTPEQLDGMWERLKLDEAVEEAVENMETYRLTRRSGLKRVEEQALTASHNME